MLIYEAIYDSTVKKDEKTSFLFARSYNLQKGTSINNVRHILLFFCPDYLCTYVSLMIFNLPTLKSNVIYGGYQILNLTYLINSWFVVHAITKVVTE